MRKKRNILKRNSGFVVGCVFAAGASFLTVDLVLADVLTVDLFMDGSSSLNETEEETEAEAASIPEETEDTRTYETDAFTVTALGEILDGVETEKETEEETETESETEMESETETEEETESETETEEETETESETEAKEETKTGKETESEETKSDIKTSAVNETSADDTESNDRTSSSGSGRTSSSGSTGTVSYANLRAH
ncbi:MAG: hypothetical protein LUH53_06055 [Lachnospiraceae bacterium]|nr:hypothetical protein [Lachnospiraceae bacterium]